jgi:hypothetical protein
MTKTTVDIPDKRLAELEAYKDKLGQLELLCALFGQVGLPSGVYQLEFVVRAHRKCD